MDCVKQDFSSRLVESLKEIYGGRLPAIAVIARDFSRKAPQLPHISTETMRKWLRGESIPHASRMQVLVNWLGVQVTAPFEMPVKALQEMCSEALGNSEGDSAEQSQPMYDELIATIQRLSEKECLSILAIAHLLADKHNDVSRNPSPRHSGDGNGETEY